MAADQKNEEFELDREEKERVQKFITDLGIKTAVSTAMHPLNFAKYLPNVFSYLRNVYQEAGVKAIYKGIEASILSNVTGAATSFAVTMYLDRYYPEIGGAPMEEKEESQMTNHESFRVKVRQGIRQSIAHTMGTLVSRPFTVIMVREIAQHVGGENKYPNVWSSLWRIGHEEGIAGFFSGLIPDLIAGYITIWAVSGIRYAAERFLEQAYDKTDEAAVKNAKDVRFVLQYAIPFVVGTLSYPFNVVSTVMAVSGSGLTVSLLPYSPVFSHWNDAYSYMKPYGLSRGKSLFMREQTGPVSHSCTQTWHWGAERLVVDAALALRSRGHEIKIVTNHFSEDHCFADALSFKDQITVVAGFPRSFFSKFNALCAYIRICIAAVFICLKDDPDIIFCDSISAPLAVFRCFSNAKLFFYCHYPDQLLTQRQSSAKKAYRFVIDHIENFTTGLADVIFVNSQYTESVFRSCFSSLSNRKLHVLYPSLNTKYFDEQKDVGDEEIAELSGISKDYKYVFMSLNRFEVKKNIELAVRAFALLKHALSEDEFSKCLLVLAGGYDILNNENIAYHKHLKEVVEELDVEDSVVFVQSPGDETKVQLLRRSQLIIYTPENEHFGIVPLEAMYLKRPVLANNTGGPRETIVNGETGFLRDNTPPLFVKECCLLYNLLNNFKKRLLDKHLRQVCSRKEIEELCDTYGLEVDDVLTEKNEETGEDEEVYKIEVPANRSDLLCVEGLSRALLIFQKKIDVPVYTTVKVKKPMQIIIEAETAKVRPYAVGAILRGVELDKDSYASFIDLQDKLHQNICRKRSLVAIGTHDLERVKGTVRYRALDPRKISFIPLKQDRTFNAVELMELYSNGYLKEFLPIIRDKEVYPVFYDENDVVLSMPPIINGEHTKIEVTTKNIFIEATGTDLKKLEIVLDTLVTMFGQYCRAPFTIEPVHVIYPDGTTRKYPMLEYREQTVDVPRMNAKIGIEQTTEQVMELLTKMGLSCKPVNGEPSKINVIIPPTRHDILHECDIAEDLGLAFGFNNIVPCLPDAHTIAQPLLLNKFSDQLRIHVAAAGWTEVLNFALCSTEDVSSKLRKPNELADVVKISNPKTLEFQVVRNQLIPGLLKTLFSNMNMPLPLKLFEVQDVVYIDPSQDTNCRNERHLAAVFYSQTGGFETIHGLLDRVMQLMDVKLGVYTIREANDPTFFNGRCAEVLVEGKAVGIFGIIHPEVLANFELKHLCAALELNVEPFI
uniref:Phenylalanine--tRNA ligase beta subunit n=1 Tax=Ditylenchus dipsaci TaxID=166011 RepID=A0A915D1U1_9BILA